MYYTSSLIKKYISVNDSIENLSHYLTMKTCEIEEIKKRQIPREVVIGEVKEVFAHPEADSLLVCKVDCGKEGVYQIVTGGENVSEGYYVPVALPGCYLEVIGLTVDSRKMKGYDSSGMICSKYELNINEDTDKHWIWLLQSLDEKEGDLNGISQDDKGKPLVDVFGWIENDILDVDNKTLTHRPDLTGHLGLGFEINAIYNVKDRTLIGLNKIKEYRNSFLDIDIMQLLQETSESGVKINGKSENLRTYLLLELNNVSVFESDFFTRLNLLDLGISPKNNRVDFSNLFMFLTGQPIHFFDADKVEGNISVRQAEEGEEFFDLFGERYELSSEDMVIADEEKVLALAGVVGGYDSSITEETKNICAEIANFDPIRVRKTANRLGIRTDSQIRFEKNISPAYSLYVLLVFLDELKYFEKTLGNFERGGLDYFINQNLSQEELCLDKKVSIDLDKIDKFVFGEKKEGFSQDVQLILDGLGFESGKEGELKIPLLRSPDDINLKEDIYEEAIRIYGYENVEAKPMQKEVTYNFFNKEVFLKRLLERVLVEQTSFDQLDTYPWVRNQLLDYFGVDKDQLIELENPISGEEKYLRDSLFYNLLDVVGKNYRVFDDIRIFDDGKIWSKDFQDMEKNSISLMVYKRKTASWKEDNILFLKGVLESIKEELDIDKEVQIKPTGSEVYHPRKQGEVFIDGRKVGFIGELNPFYYSFYKFPTNSNIAYLEIFKDELAELFDYNSVGVQELNYESLQDQIVFRDLSFLIDKDRYFSEIVDSVKSVEGVKGVNVFDLYSGENIPEGMKSISLEIKIIGDGSYTTEHINNIMSSAIQKVEEKGGKLRE